MSTNVYRNIPQPTCPLCDCDSYDVHASEICPNDWHQLLGNRADAACRRAWIEARAAGRTAGQAYLAGADAQRAVLDQGTTWVSDVVPPYAACATRMDDAS